MEWFFIALGAPFLWALVNIADKYLVTNYSTGKNSNDKSSGALVLFSSLVGIFAAGGIGIFSTNVFDISTSDKVLLFGTGVFSIVWILLYLFALEIEEVSAVVPWMLTIPIFGYILSYFFLGEMLSSRELIGGGIVILGAVILSVDFSKVHLMFKKRISGLMLTSSLIYAINGVIFKFIASAESFWVASFWEYLGLGVGGIFIFVFIRRYRVDFIETIQTSGIFIFSVNVMSEITTIAGNLLTNFALLIAPVAMVYMVGSFQPVVVLMLTYLSTKFSPKIVTEDFSRKIILPKIVAIAVMIAGSVILFS
jgi:drug/metabolite transporter (DMT)-like permease